LNFIFDWIDIATGEKLSIPWSASGCNGDDKGLGSALTYAERYFILKQFNIPTDDDDPDAFQDKHLTADEKKKIEEDRKSKEKEELQTAITNVSKCETVADMTALRQVLAPYIVASPEFVEAGKARYEFIMAQKETV